MNGGTKYPPQDSVISWGLCPLSCYDAAKRPKDSSASPTPRWDDAQVDVASIDSILWDLTFIQIKHPEGLFLGLLKVDIPLQFLFIVKEIQS